MRRKVPEIMRGTITLRNLIQEWRKEARLIREQQLDREPGYRGWVERNVIHADELEAAIIASGERQTDPTWIYKLATTIETAVASNIGPTADAPRVRNVKLISKILVEYLPELVRDTQKKCLDWVGGYAGPVSAEDDEFIGQLLDKIDRRELDAKIEGFHLALEGAAQKFESTHEMEIAARIRAIDEYVLEFINVGRGRTATVLRKQGGCTHDDTDLGHVHK
jgi:hypothetical protein